MRLSPEHIKSSCGSVVDAFIRNHLERLDERYFNRFEEYQIAGHITALSRVKSDHPVEVLFDRFGENSVGCTVLSFDYPSVFALITGILNSFGLDILAGNVFTYSRDTVRANRALHRRRYSRRRITEDPLMRRRIVDHFTGILTTRQSWNDWKKNLTGQLEQAIALLEKGDDPSLEKARRNVNQLVADHLDGIEYDSTPVLYPVSIDVDNDEGPWTRLKVASEDTPAFLYSLSNALSLNDMSIEQVSISTVDGRVQDIIDIVDRFGKKLTETSSINQIKLSVLLTKQFTYFLGQSPNPYVALVRFEQLVKDMIKNPDQEKWLDYMSNPRILQELARLLGASDYLWEDFIRLQYEELLPIIGPHTRGHRFSNPETTLKDRLTQLLDSCATMEEKQRRLNEFKDREAFLIDLDHILDREFDFKALAEHLSKLAEVIVDTATSLAYNELISRFGEPGTVAGLPARHVVFGLGKLGGAALGYASDIELLFVYSDNGTTTGNRAVDNGEFFSRLVKQVNRIIRTKREGIFNIDLRLRPYGKDGPLASSLENFCNYYGPHGPAHSYERLALVRLRTISGDPGLGAQIERIRDDIVYESQSIKPREIKELREKQYAEKKVPGKLNAKFNPGALVDLEYDVQLLQVIHGKNNPVLRTPRLHEALEGLAHAGVLGSDESLRLSAAYDFFRRLINGLRMLRGTATDLFLPSPDDDEFMHLARRMGYGMKDGMHPAQQLRTDFDSQTAIVRSFVAKHFGRESLPGPAIGNVADLVLLEDIDIDLAHMVLSKSGFGKPDRAYVNLQSLAGADRESFARLAVLACDILRNKPDADMALNNWEQFVNAVGARKEHYERLLSQPMQLEILLSIFAGSQFLANILIRNPGFLDWVIIPENLRRETTADLIENELGRIAESAHDHTDWLHRLRQFRRREILRIGTLDICLRSPLELITRNLSDLAEGIIRVSLKQIFAGFSGKKTGDRDVGEQEDRFCILAFGKLGGRELNYSSDIDLLAAYDETRGEITEKERELFAKVIEHLRSDLSSYMVEGHVFRVDLRLRPYGRSGRLVNSVKTLADYYSSTASLWEIQALLKLRPVGGNRKIGESLVATFREILRKKQEPDTVIESIERLRASAIKKQAPTGNEPFDVKVGAGGIRDIEFTVQGLQLIHTHASDGIIDGNTLVALERLRNNGIITADTALQLSEDYQFLRKIEHALQILEDQQKHAIPTNRDAVIALAKRILGVGAGYDDFMDAVEACRKRIRGAYDEFRNRE
ncbi:MAG: glutamate-ammonia-ligase adenylyltransferase [Chitinivibrionales bacterium]|nr:glutamate-ammonia-ligase adenylyltransferase [Chitinivibrionales bacterium]